MIVLVILVPVLILATGLLMGGIFGPAYPARWWLLRVGLVPFLCWLLAAYLMATPAEIPLDYDPDVHGNPGRADFVATVFFGLMVPALYTMIALPVTLGPVLIRRRLASARTQIMPPVDEPL